MKNIVKKERGITLIALIITIIVMLILVMVSIRIAIQTGLFDSAGKATGDYKTVQEAEQELGSGKVNIDNKTYNSIDEYVNTKNTITFSVLRRNLENLEIEEKVSFTVEKGTTWEGFLAGNKMGIGYWYYDGSYDSVGAPYPLGCICMSGSGAVYEMPGSHDVGPWIFPEDPIKNGVTYNWIPY